ncbi:MAG: ComEC/Rec2 family competence protein, partial [Candidatus Eremiobacteraeota bacterium]|nr:ComEC/Rec2 family competence protein [Candidatus Eremiobacteraeota bacterium]
MRAPLVVPALLFLTIVALAKHLGRFDLPSPVETEGVIVRGAVVSDVSVRDWGDAYEVATADGTRFAISSQETVAPGERLVLRGRLEPFDDARNPGEASPREMAQERGLYARLERAAVLSRAPPDLRDLRVWPARLRAWASAALEHSLSPPDTTILAGMLYGARGALPDDLRAEFQDTGTVHVLVTAGLHLGVIAVLVAFVLRLLGAGRVSGALATIPVIWAYAILSGAHLPSLRAATMVTVALFARALGERAISLNTLALAAIVVAALWPASVGGASFGLSFSCVGAIALFAEPISKGLERLRIPAVLREPLALTLATQIGVWPLTATTFLVIAPYAIVANALVVPVVGAALIGGLAVLAATPIPTLAGLVARLEAWPLAWIEGVVHLTARLPAAHVVATPPPAWTVGIYDVALVAAAALLHAPGVRRRVEPKDVSCPPAS